MFAKFIITSSRTGTPPPARVDNDYERSRNSMSENSAPTSPVFPPCGTTAMLFSLHHLRMRLTCSVDVGLSTHFDEPLYFPIQSLLNGSKSSTEELIGDSVLNIEDFGKMPAK